MKNRLLTISFLLLIACNSEISLDNALNMISKQTPITLDNWEIVEKLGDKGFRQYVLFQEKADTTHILNFRTELNEVHLSYHDIRFEDENFKYFVSMKADTIYYYKESKTDSVKIFICGEYAFKNKRGKLTAEQSKYFRLHEDSLKAILGNNLPELPGISIFKDENDSIEFEGPIDN